MKLDMKTGLVVAAAACALAVGACHHKDQDKSTVADSVTGPGTSATISPDSATNGAPTATGDSSISSTTGADGPNKSGATTGNKNGVATRINSDGSTTTTNPDGSTTTTPK